MQSNRFIPTKRYLTACGAFYGDVSPPTFTKRPKVKRKRQHPEQDLQIEIVQWCESHGLLVHAIPNEGRRSLYAGQRMRMAGLKKDVADLFLAEPVMPIYAGYYIEVKAPGQKPRPGQLEFLTLARKKGYKAEWFDNLEAACDSIVAYLSTRSGNV